MTRLEMIDAMRFDREKLIDELYWLNMKKKHAREAGCQPVIVQCDEKIDDILILLDSIQNGLKAIGR